MNHPGMNHLALVLSASLCLASPLVAGAQTAAPSTPAPAGGPAAKTGGAPDAKTGGTQDARTACREKAKGQGLRGKEMRQAMMDCIGKENPAMAETLKCKMGAKEKGLKGGSDEMRSFMKSCRKNKS